MYFTLKQLRKFFLQKIGKHDSTCNRGITSRPSHTCFHTFFVCLFCFFCLRRPTDPRNACHFLYKRERRSSTFFNFFNSFNLKNEHCNSISRHRCFCGISSFLFTFQESSSSGKPIVYKPPASI